MLQGVTTQKVCRTEANIFKRFSPLVVVHFNCLKLIYLSSQVMVQVITMAETFTVGTVANLINILRS